MWASGLVSNIMSLVDMEEILASGVRNHYVLALLLFLGYYQLYVAQCLRPLREGLWVAC
jgi:hypothetical protein